MQNDESGKPHPCYYLSRALQGAEVNYCTTDLEALAVVYALQRFRTFVWGQPVEIRTDHSALTALMSKRELPPRMACWAAQIQEYNPVIVYKPGRVNQAADALSRLPRLPDEKASAVPCDEHWILSVLSDSLPPKDPGNRQFMPLNPEKAKLLKYIMQDVELVVIDEFSMVSNSILRIIDERLNQV